MAAEKTLIDANTKLIEKHFTKRLIDGHALIDVIENTDWYHISPKGKLESGANSQENIPLYKASDIHRALANAPAVDAVEIDILEDWLYEIAKNNFGNGLCRSCLEIVDRLDGLRNFARERKDHGKG